jgi:predicted Rossmann fold flavoprotein
VVVGGGAAGLMAAGRAAEQGARVLLLEKTPRLGNKLRLTGGGRGNITHVGDAQQIAEHLGPNGAFLRGALAQFGPRELAVFFHRQGLPTVVEPDGRVLPASHNAHTVVTTLRRYCLEHGVTFRYHSQVRSVLRGAEGVCGVTVGDIEIAAGAVILATGGLSYPGTGSTGDGYEMARRLGHTIVPPRAGLVALVAADPWIPEVEGLSLRDVALGAWQRSHRLATRRGDVLFTRDGISGPAALNLSLDVAQAFERGRVRLRIDLLPDTPQDTLEADLEREMREHGSASYRSLLRGRVPRSLAAVYERLGGIPGERRLAQVSAAERERTVALLKALELQLVATRPIAEAMVTLGGVACDEIEPMSMASRRVQGLYLAGEILDVAGETGGYNLQAAFTSGWLAGTHAARQG